MTYNQAKQQHHEIVQMSPEAYLIREIRTGNKDAWNQILEYWRIKREALIEMIKLGEKK